MKSLIIMLVIAQNVETRPIPPLPTTPQSGRCIKSPAVTLTPKERQSRSGHDPEAAADAMRRALALSPPIDCDRRAE